MMRSQRLTNHGWSSEVAPYGAVLPTIALCSGACNKRGAGFGEAAADGDGAGGGAPRGVSRDGEWPDLRHPKYDRQIDGESFTEVNGLLEPTWRCRRGSADSGAGTRDNSEGHDGAHDEAHAYVGGHGQGHDHADGDRPRLRSRLRPRPHSCSGAGSTGLIPTHEAWAGLA